jgi:5-methyltetrahydrofolate--homocysteine methyltransferase
MTSAPAAGRASSGALGPFLERVKSGPVIIADGAMGSFLMERGLEPGQAPESLNLTRPELLGEVASAYLEAGAELIQTNTFGGSALKLSSYGLDERTEEINRAAVQAVREAAAGKAYISGSCGPSGCTLLPYGDTEPEEVRESFSRQIGALVEAGIDVLCIETMTDLSEAVAAVEVARSISADIPVMATMTFDTTPRGYYTIMGVDIPTAARSLLGAGADLVGSNCGNGIDNMIEIARAFRESTEAPLLIQPNAGMPVLAEGRIVYGETPEFMAERALLLVEIGVEVIGGCCGTTPDHTRRLREALRH